MSVLGRYVVVRWYWVHTGGLSEPLVLDRVRRTLAPYRGDADARVEHAVVTEAEARRRDMAARVARVRAQLRDEPTRLRRQRLADRLLSRDADGARLCAVAVWGRDNYFPAVWNSASQFATAGTASLNAAYTAGSAGPAAGVRFQTANGRTLSKVYFFVSSYTGTAANVNDLNLEVRPEASAGATTPNTGTLTEGKTVNPASATGWIESAGWTASLTAGGWYVVVGDADGTGTDFATLQTSFGWTAATIETTARAMRAVTTNGWSAGTLNAAAANVVLVFADGATVGSPIAGTTTPASSTQQRGLRITAAGIRSNLTVFGVLWGNASSTVSAFKIFAGNTAPDGTAAATWTDYYYGTTNAGGLGFLSATPYTLQAGTAYSLVAAYGSANQAGPRRSDIGTGETADLRLAMPGAGEWYWRQDDGGSTWANDLVGSLPNVGLLVDGQAVPVRGPSARNLFPGGGVS